MNEERLKEIYAESEVAKAFLDHMAGRDRIQTETKVHRILRLLRGEGFDFSRRDIVALFKDLEDAECGQFIVGRRGWPSRLVWNIDSLAASRLASGENQEIEEIWEEDEEEEEEILADIRPAVEIIKHSFHLRRDHVVKIWLPVKLTKKEAERLSLFVQSLPFDDDEEG